MREIKFRVWNTETNKMIINVKEMGVFALQSIYSIDEFLVIPTNEKYPLMQYTGLKDKNGVEIYEGDIILKSGFGKFKEIEEKSIVKIINGNTYAYYDETDKELISNIKFPIEVIGNIYKNPELLKEGL